MQVIDSSIVGGLNGYQNKAESLVKQNCQVNINTIKPPVNFMTISLTNNYEKYQEIGKENIH